MHVDAESELLIFCFGFLWQDSALLLAQDPEREQQFSPCMFAFQRDHTQALEQTVLGGNLYSSNGRERI